VPKFSNPVASRGRVRLTGADPPICYSLRRTHCGSRWTWPVRPQTGRRPIGTKSAPPRRAVTRWRSWMPS